MRVMIVTVVVVIGFAVFVSSKQIKRSRRIQEEVAALEAEASKIRRENETLSERISYFSSSDFREQEAKKKLGLKKIGETLAVIKLAPEYNGEKQERNIQNEIAIEVAADDTKENVSNYKKWWKIFF